jgi:hypothetical protein
VFFHVIYKRTKTKHRCALFLLNLERKESSTRSMSLPEVLLEEKECRVVLLTLYFRCLNARSFLTRICSNNARYLLLLQSFTANTKSSVLWKNLILKNLIRVSFSNKDTHPAFNKYKICKMKKLIRSVVRKIYCKN